MKPANPGSPGKMSVKMESERGREFKAVCFVHSRLNVLVTVFPSALLNAVYLSRNHADTIW